MSIEEKDTASSSSEKYRGPRLIVEGGIQVQYKGVWVSEVPFDQDEISVGVMDRENNIYPDINLRQYRLEGGDPYISRRHSRYTREGDDFFVEDICNNNSTSVGEKSDIVNGEKRQLSAGTRIFISESIVMRFETSDDAEIDIEAVSSKANIELPPNSPLWYLEVDKQTPLFFRTRNIFTHIFELDPKNWELDPVDQNPALQIGRHSTEDGIYPDIDLWKFYFNDGDEYIARRHARVYLKDGKFYFQDVSGKGSTWYNERNDENRLVRTEEDEAGREIQVGDKLIISDSVVFVVCQQEEGDEDPLEDNAPPTDTDTGEE